MRVLKSFHLFSPASSLELKISLPGAVSRNFSSNWEQRSLQHIISDNVNCLRRSLHKISENFTQQRNFTNTWGAHLYIMIDRGTKYSKNFKIQNSYRIGIYWYILKCYSQVLSTSFVQRSWFRFVVTFLQILVIMILLIDGNLFEQRICLDTMDEITLLVIKGSQNQIDDNTD